MAATPDPFRRVRRASEKARRLEEQLRQARTELRQAVVDAVNEGASMNAIARELGISRQRVAQLVERGG